MVCSKGVCYGFGHQVVSAGDPCGVEGVETHT